MAEVTEAETTYDDPIPDISEYLRAKAEDIGAWIDCPGLTVADAVAAQRLLAGMVAEADARAAALAAGLSEVTP